MDMKSMPVLSVILMLLVDVVLGKDDNKGQWTSWSSWSVCSSSCGSGTTTRARYWEQPPSEKKFETPFTMTENQACTSENCPVDGTWGMWLRWSPCSEACGGGISQRKRVCHEPWDGGRACEGENFEEEECNRVPCPPLPPRFNLSSCTKKHFMCTTGRMCIPIDELCDNTVQCNDGSDEKRCYDVDNPGSVQYSYVKDKGSTYGASLSVITGLVAMVIMVRVIG